MCMWVIHLAQKYNLKSKGIFPTVPRYLISPGVLSVRLTSPPTSFSGGAMVTDLSEYDTGNLQSFMQFRSLPHVARLKL